MSKRYYVLNQKCFSVTVWTCMSLPIYTLVEDTGNTRTLLLRYCVEVWTSCCFGHLSVVWAVFKMLNFHLLCFSVSWPNKCSLCCVCHSKVGSHVFVKTKIILCLFWQILQLCYDSRLVGMIISASQFLFSLKNSFVGVCIKQLFFLLLENKTCRPGHLFSTTVLHYKAVFFTNLTFTKKIAASAIWLLHLATFRFRQYYD